MGLWCARTAGTLLAVLLLSACGGESGEPRTNAGPEATAGEAPVRHCASTDGIDFVPATFHEEDSVVLPITFLDGTHAELVYPPELDLAKLGVFPYGSGSLRGKSPSPGRGDVVARDFWIRYGNLEDLLALRNDGRAPPVIARYEGAGGRLVGLWNLDSNDTSHYLGFQFGCWSVLVYDYVAAGAMTESERVSWARNFSGSETPAGFLLLESSGPLRLAEAGERAGPELTFSASEPTRAFILYAGECRQHRDQTRRIDGKHVRWSGAFADWCLSDSMRIHAEGSRNFIRGLVRGLEVRNVTIARS